MRKISIRFFIMLSILIFLLILLINISQILSKKPFLANFLIISYLLYLASIEAKGAIRKIVIYAIVVLLAILFYGYYFA